MFKNAIDIEELVYKIGQVPILTSITLGLKANKFYSILGPNGSGKTTLLKNISKIIKVPTDTVYINGVDIAKLSNRDIARIMSYVPQSETNDFEFTVEEIVTMGRNPHLNRFRHEGKEDVLVVQEAMKLANVWDIRNKKINQLSGGEAQRVIIARAIAQKAQIMLLDEPVSHLDVYHQLDILERIKTLVTSGQTTVLAVLHDLNLALEYSDYILLLNNGKIIAEGIPEDVVTGQNIRDVYNLDIHITNNPSTGKPHIIPLKVNV